MNKCIVISADGFFDESTMRELVAENSNVNFTFVPQKNFVSADVIITIAFELMKSLAYSGCYDLMKHVLLSVWEKAKHLKKEHVAVTIVKDGKTSKIDFPFELSEEQKDRVVDAAIRKLLD